MFPELVEECAVVSYTPLIMVGLALTPEQFKALLRMIYVANTVINGHREKGYLKEYDDLEQYIFSRAGAAGFPAATWSHKTSDIGSESADGDLSEVSSQEEEHHHPSRIFENDRELVALMDEYDRAMVTEFLAETLAERDIERKHGPAAKTRMPEKDYEELLDCYAEAYAEEFQKFGFGRMVVVKETAEAEKKVGRIAKGRKLS
ncbi:MAG: hypothetical protein A3H76_03835 [Candidatus Lloydbacteria bacterium RIFCSPLOWO2_02_FULL_54_12]|nr:MAG: hypothetical protein A3H76_03835 [Candidatus Lloydbacteria bacterium RIFCSPLOWO2_02_FULL_54_12]